ncbi:HEPN domain-containing protein [Pedobacter steynii]|uniref:Uncharacterized protein n=1 Tax=Pedobacter steynii TaxID=430522 RepID=A0A1D7QCU5_9SPHI|nr:HEPN domain-containing protein [Pedobacter steynii]AOM76518.1 hypothetical protein BFS30_04725 [Pedobacter steynii]
MKLETSGTYKFEIICIDPNGSTNITTERSIKYNLLSNEKIWKRAEYSEKHIEDKDLNIKLHAHILDDKKTLDFKAGFKISVATGFDIMERIRIDIVEHLRNAKFETVYVLTDDVSETISKGIYPQINTIENLLRKYLIQFFITQLGTNWWNHTSDDKMKQKTRERKDNERVFSKHIDNQAYLIDFGDLGKLIYSQSSGYNEKKDIVEQLEMVSTIEQLKEFREKLKPNYSKYFLKAFKEKDFQSKWQQLEKIRHKVAHNNLFVMQDFDEAKSLTTDLKSIIDSAIKDVDQNKVDLTASDKIAIRESFFSSFDSSIYIITEEEFLKALDETQIWAETNASGFVGLKHFIQNVLTERKGFSFGPSSALVNILVDKGEIELFEVPSLDKSHTLKAIRRKLS